MSVKAATATNARVCHFRGSFGGASIAAVHPTKLIPHRYHSHVGSGVADAPIATSPASSTTRPIAEKSLLREYVATISPAIKLAVPVKNAAPLAK